MSEQEELKLFERIRENITVAQRRMFERKAKLNESVVIADSNGLPMEIPAERALRLLKPQK